MQRDVHFLEAYAVLATPVCTIPVLTGFTGLRGRRTFEELDVQRIHIVDGDGTLRRVISNQERQHPGIVNGTVIERSSPRPPGMIFFKHLGDEMGGLIIGATGELGHIGSLTWDKVRNDQTIGCRHLEGDDGAYSTGLEMRQQPNTAAEVMMARYDSANAVSDPYERARAIRELQEQGQLTTRRLLFGTGRNDAMLIDMHDVQGRTRLRMSVAPAGTASLEFLDESGSVVHAVPER